MLEIPQRVEMLEKRVEDYTTLFADIRQGLQRFEARVNARFAGVDTRFTSIDARFTQMETRFTQIDARFTQMETRFTQMDARFTQMDARFTDFEQKFQARMSQVDGRLTALDQKVDDGRRDMTTHFRWTIGVMVTCLAAIVAGMGAIFAAVVSQ